NLNPFKSENSLKPLKNFLDVEEDVEQLATHRSKNNKMRINHPSSQLHHHQTLQWTLTQYLRIWPKYSTGFCSPTKTRRHLHQRIHHQCRLLLQCPRQHQHQRQHRLTMHRCHCRHHLDLTGALCPTSSRVTDTLMELSESQTKPRIG